jgi:hypothetical protein
MLTAKRTILFGSAINHSYLNGISPCTQICSKFNESRLVMNAVATPTSIEFDEKRSRLIVDTGIEIRDVQFKYMILVRV